MNDKGDCVCDNETEIYNKRQNKYTNFVEAETNSIVLRVKEVIYFYCLLVLINTRILELNRAIMTKIYKKNVIEKKQGN